MITSGGPLPGQVSYLAIDCGTATTSAVLVDLVAGAYQLIAGAAAPTTINSHWNNVMPGVRDAVTELSRITGRRLLSESGDLISPEQPNGAGVDSLVLTCSAGEPMEVVLVGLLEDVSVASLRRALHATYGRCLADVNLADGRSGRERTEVIAQQHPDLVLVAGGTDGGGQQPLLRMLEVVDQGIRLLNDLRPPAVLFAGNSHLREQVMNTLDDVTEVSVADNIRPTLQEERLENTVRLLGEQYVTRKVTDLPGMGELSGWSSLPILPTSEAFARSVAILSALEDHRILGVDLGARSVLLVGADFGRPHLLVSDAPGVVDTLLRSGDEDQLAGIMRWTPETLTREELLEYLADRRLHSPRAAMAQNERLIEQAVACHVLCRAMETVDVEWADAGGLRQNISFPGMLVFRGRVLTETITPAQAIAVLLDVLQPGGVFPIKMDQNGVLPALGAIAPLQPLVPLQVLEAGALLDLGWIVAPTGKTVAGETALEVILESESIGRLSLEVEGGKIEVVPLRYGEEARLELIPHSLLDVGAGAGQRQMVTVSGGAVGLIVDARGRPLPDLIALPGKVSGR